MENSGLLWTVSEFLRFPGPFGAPKGVVAMELRRSTGPKWFLKSPNAVFLDGLGSVMNCFRVRQNIPEYFRNISEYSGIKFRNMDRRHSGISPSSPAVDAREPGVKEPFLILYRLTTKYKVFFIEVLNRLSTPK